MRKSSPNAAAIEIEDAMVLTTGEDHARAEGITALRADQAGLQQQLQGIAEVAEMGAQFSARGKADAQFFDHGGIAESALQQVVHGFGMTGELELIEGRGVLEELSRGSEVLAQVGDATTEGEMQTQLKETNQVTPAPPAMTVEQALVGGNVTGGMCFLTQ